MYDLFISHASEDKEGFVRPFVNSLERLGVKVWYDDFSLKLGDSLSRSIDEGIKNSRYGLIVISKNFLVKQWPDYEYRSLLSRQVNERSLILPLWYGVSKNDIMQYSPFLADLKAASVNSKDDYKKAILQIVEVIRPDIFREVRLSIEMKRLEREAQIIKIPLSHIMTSSTKHSKLSMGQKIRIRNIFHGIGKFYNHNLEECYEQFQHDHLPEREIQEWEKMNLCYLQMIERYPDSTEADKKRFYAILLLISTGNLDSPLIRLDPFAGELMKLWTQLFA